MTTRKQTRTAAAILGSLGGKAATAAKRAAARENGKRGGRPSRELKAITDAAASRNPEAVRAAVAAAKAAGCQQDAIDRALLRGGVVVL